MAEQALRWLWIRLRPPDGWLPLALMATAAAAVVGAVLAVDWTPEVGVVRWTVAGGLLLGTLLAYRSLHAVWAWGLLLGYGLLTTAVLLGNLWPTWPALAGGPPTLRAYWLQNGALLLDRMGGWFRAALSGEPSQETIVFSFGLGLLGWLLAAYAAWSAFHRRRPLPGLTALGAAMALNGYFGGGGVAHTALFVGIAVLLTAVMQFGNLVYGWERRGVDYSAEIRFELAGYTGMIALALLTAALLLPALPYSAVARRFAETTAVRQAEQTLERVFGGVGGSGGGPGLRDGPGGSGVLPRSYLLGNPPELAETVMFTATVETATPVLIRHWRGVSYDTYTGRGWARSEERRESVAAGAPIPLPDARATGAITQTVHWSFDRRLTAYTLGPPLRFAQPTATFWYGLSDLSRVQAQLFDVPYTAVSRLSAATPDALRATAVADVPPALLSRYTNLPGSVSERVVAQAEAVAGALDNPYDQALALETFLRQYPYSLDVPLPPRDVDPVDYFLFDLQRGYCDYYASAMVVMARGLGLPARLSSGFLAQPPDERGVQTVVQLNSHSWPEVYFASYGWVEFEPTRPFAATPAADAPSDQAPPETSAPTFEAPPPIPEAPTPQPPFPWTRLAGLLALLAAIPAGWLLWQRRAGMGRDGVLWAYGRLQHSARRLGQPPRPSQTPAEFQAALLARLDALSDDGSQRWWRERLAAARPEIERLTALFVSRQYGGRREEGEGAARESWRRLRRPLWWLRWVSRLRRD